MQTANGPNTQYKTSIVIWFAFLMSQLMFLPIIFLTRRELFTLDFSQPVLGRSMAQIFGFAFAALTVFILSFAFRTKFNERAAAERKPEYVQYGLIVACALCEACTLFGVALAFAFDYQYFFFWIALGVVGVLLHFPRRVHVDAVLGNKP